MPRAISQNLQRELVERTRAAEGQHRGASFSVAVCNLDGRPVAGVHQGSTHQAHSLAELNIALAEQRLRRRARAGLNREITLQPSDRGDGGPLASQIGRRVMMREALAEALVVSGETGSRAVTRAIGGPKAVNQALKSGLLVVSGLQPPEGSEHLSTKPDAPYLHGWTNAEETATTFAALLREDGFAARALTFGNGTSGIRREIDPVWGDNWRPAGSQHPADVLMAELDQLIAIDPSGPEATARLGRLLDPDWQPSAFPNKVAADNDRKIGILSLHDVCQVGELVVASLVSLGFGEEPDFPLDNNHPAYNFHASVGELVAAA